MQYTTEEYRNGDLIKIYSPAGKWLGDVHHWSTQGIYKAVSAKHGALQDSYHDLKRYPTLEEAINDVLRVAKI